MVSRDPGLLASLVSSNHVGGNSKALEILGVQLPLAMSRRQLVECVSPRPTLERRARSFRTIGYGHRLTITPALLGASYGTVYAQVPRALTVVLPVPLKL